MATAVTPATITPSQQERGFLNINWDNPWEWLPIALFMLSLLATALIIVFAPDSAKLALMVPVALVLLLTMAVRPELILVISIAYTPFESEAFKPIALPGGLSVAKILGFALLGIFFFNVAIRRRKFRLFDDPQDLTILLLAGAFLISGVTSEFPGKTWTSASRMLRMLIYYFAVKNLLSSYYVMRATMWVIAISGGLAGVWGINDYLVQNAVMIHDVRTGGVYMDPNDYAALAVVVIIVTLHLMEITRSIFHQQILALCMISSLISLVVGASRMGFLCLGVVVFIYLWRHPRRKLLLTVAILSVVISFPMWPESVRVRFTGAGDELGDNVYTATTEHSTERRASYVVFGTGLIAEFPITGTGYGTFSRLYPQSEFARYDNPMTDSERYRLAHNAYLEITVGTGFVGLISFLLVLLTALYYLHQCSSQAIRGTVFWAASSAFELSLISLMICSAFLSIEHFNYTWISVAMSSVLALRLREERALMAKNMTLLQDREA